MNLLKTKKKNNFTEEKKSKQKPGIRKKNPQFFYNIQCEQDELFGVQSEAFESDEWMARLWHHLGEDNLLKIEAFKFLINGTLFPSSQTYDKFFKQNRIISRFLSMWHQVRPHRHRMIHKCTHTYYYYYCPIRKKCILYLNIFLRNWDKANWTRDKEREREQTNERKKEREFVVNFRALPIWKCIERWLNTYKYIFPYPNEQSWRFESRWSKWLWFTERLSISQFVLNFYLLLRSIFLASAFFSLLFNWHFQMQKKKNIYS